MSTHTHSIKAGASKTGSATVPNPTGFATTAQLAALAARVVVLEGVKSTPSVPLNVKAVPV